MDRNPSFGIEVSPVKISKCHCFSCGFAGELTDLITLLRHKVRKDVEAKAPVPNYDFKTALQLIAQEEDGGILSFVHADEEEDKTVTHYFDEDWLSSFKSYRKFEDARAYLASRNVPKWVADDLDLRFDARERRICFPVRDFNGDLVGLHGRGIDKHPIPPYRMYTDTYPNKGGHNNPLIWYGEDKVDFEKPVVVVESVFDYARVYECYKNVICPLTAEIKKDKILRVQDMVVCIDMFDGDDPGRRASSRMRKELSHVRFKTIRLKEGTDPGKMSVMDVRKILKKYLKTYLIT